jgi:hypothetical protein
MQNMHLDMQQSSETDYAKEYAEYLKTKFREYAEYTNKYALEYAAEYAEYAKQYVIKYADLVQNVQRIIHIFSCTLGIFFPARIRGIRKNTQNTQKWGINDKYAEYALPTLLMRHCILHQQSGST